MDVITAWDQSHVGQQKSFNVNLTCFRNMLSSLSVLRVASVDITNCKERQMEFSTVKYTTLLYGKWQTYQV